MRTIDRKFDLVICKKYVEEDNLLSKATFLKESHNVADKTWQKLNTEFQCKLPSLTQKRRRNQT
jgi:hypothetical protein